MMDAMKKLVKESNHIVVFGGLQLMYEQGLNGVRCDLKPYDIEMEYGYSADEMMTNLFLTRNGSKFYHYYKNVILDKEKMVPGDGHKAVADLEKAGKLEMLVTRTIYGLYRAAGVKNIIEMHGSVYENKCPNCGKIFGPDHILEAKNVPVCDVCKVPLRPGFALLQEVMDNGKITQCAEAVERADLLLIVGANLEAPLCKHFLKYFDGKAILLINNKETTSDDKADYAVYGKCSELLRELVDGAI